MTKKFAKPNEHGVFTEYSRIGIEKKGAYKLWVKFIEQADGWRVSLSISFATWGSSGLPSVNGTSYPTKENAITAELKQAKKQLTQNLQGSNKKDTSYNNQLVMWCNNELLNLRDAETQADTAIDALNALMG